jgi:hypothetical protein
VCILGSISAIYLVPTLMPLVMPLVCRMVSSWLHSQQSKCDTYIRALSSCTCICVELLANELLANLS